LEINDNIQQEQEQEKGQKHESPLNVLSHFEPITLKEMDNVKLMNRTDTKYVFNIRQFEKVMLEIKDYYKVLEVEGKRLNRYETLYYDTELFELYYQHHKGKLNRYKIRHRTYVESDLGFLEVKFKNNKGRTIKTRINKHDAPYTWENESEEFLTKTLPFEPNTLVPVMWVNYIRNTLVNKSGAERLTIDLNLEFIKEGNSWKFDNLVIAEVKQDKRKPSPFIQVMKKYRIREGSISKYCMGIATTCSAVKKNNFKSRLKTLNHKNS
jgi:hypothetical protein